MSKRTSFAPGIRSAAYLAAGAVLNPSSSADTISVGAAMRCNGNACRSGALSMGSH